MAANFSNASFLMRASGSKWRNMLAHNFQKRGSRANAALPTRRRRRRRQATKTTKKIKSSHCRVFRPQPSAVRARQQSTTRRQRRQGWVRRRRSRHLRRRFFRHQRRSSTRQSCPPSLCTINFYTRSYSDFRSFHRHIIFGCNVYK